ncbi:MAG: hypothetical protein RLZZ373_2693 [Pseudomonadota bacterium]
MEDDGTLSIGTRLGEFEIRGLVGIGRTGIVYRAFDHDLEREVAIKEYLPAPLAVRAADGRVQVRTPADGPAFAAGLQHFLDDARLLARFDHPALVKVFRFWEGNGTGCMVMPFYAGQTLAQALRQLPAPPAEAWLMGVLVPVLGALEALHDQRIVHNRITPDNIRLLRNGRPVLMEPGVAHESPEGPWTDLYALGEVVQTCLTSVAPPSLAERVVQDRLVPLADVAAHLHATHGQHWRESFIGAWQQTLALGPADRPQRVSALMQRLRLTPAPREEWSETLQLATPPPALRPATAGTAPKPPPSAAAIDALALLEQPRPRSYSTVAIILATLLGVGAMAYLLSRSPKGSAAPKSAPVAASVAPSAAPFAASRPPVVILDELPDRALQGASVPASTESTDNKAALAASRASATAARAAARAAQTASAAPQPLAPQPALVTSAIPSLAAPSRNAPSTQTTASPATAPAPAAPRTLDDLCGTRFFLAKELCIQDACQTTEFSRTATCVDLRRKAEEERVRKLHTDG